MAKSLKQQLQERPDVREKEILLTAFGEDEPYTCTIRRLTVAERDVLMKDYDLGKDSSKNLDAACGIVAAALVPANGEVYTPEEVRGWPAALVDEISTQVMLFNGWTKRAKAALDDQFRPTT